MSDKTDVDPDDAPEDASEATRREGPGGPRAKLPDALARGATVGRYVVLDKLGEGGMGVVYAAFDPELDRKIAIKVLQVGSVGDPAWLLREAQALARLAHPNVVSVHDVGTLPGNQLFVALELVEGVTLREWLEAEPRSWRAIVAMLRAAGEGLAAAHHAGLVHRDFKPENVIVGKDGRARVMDFGLARIQSDQDDLRLPASPDPASIDYTPNPVATSEFTFTGHLAGTPSYMAPELYAGKPADARTDQFAFGVALYEALYGKRPFGKRDLARAATTPPVVRAADTSKVPSRFHRVAMRALAVDPAERYPSMDELLVELAVDPLARRRRLVLGVGAAIALAGIAIGGVLALRSRGGTCDGAAQRLVHVWDPETKAAVKTAFLAVHKPFAQPAYDGLARALDAYAGEWTAAVTASCKATRASGEQSEQVMSVREVCFEQRLDELRALTSLLASADARIVEKGDQIAFGLEPIRRCANIEVLLEPGEPPPELREQARALSKKIAEAKANMLAGQYLPAMVSAQSVVDQATKLGYQPLIAQALVIRGSALLVAQNIPEAESVFADATFAAIRGKRDDVAAEAGLAAAASYAEQGGRPDIAKVWLGHALAAADRVGFRRDMELRVLEVQGIVAADAGDFNAAIAAHEKSIAAAEKFYGANAPELINSEVLLATTLSKAGEYGRAVPHYEHALALREASVGKEHPDVATLESDLGACYTHAGDYHKAHDAFARALAIREATYGKNSPMLMATLDNFGELLRHEGDYAGALDAQRRALAMAKTLLGASHSSYHQVATDTCDTLIAAGKLADAHALFDDVLPIEIKTGSSVLPATQSSRAELALAEKAWREAQGYAEQSITGYEAAGGKDNPALWRPLTALGRAELALDQKDAAKATLERAVAIGDKAQIPAADLATTRDALATVTR